MDSKSNTEMLTEGSERNMNYDNTKVEILTILEGRGDISFIEYRDLATGKIKILQTTNFYKRYGGSK